MLVTAVSLVDKDEKVLMQQRHFAAVHGGLWEFPGGKVEAGETPEVAATRELKEELALRILPEALEPVGFASGHTAAPSHGDPGDQRPLVILLYACRSWQGTPQVQEAEAVAWYDPEKIADLAMPPLDYPLAEALNRHLGRHSSGDKAI